MCPALLSQKYLYFYHDLVKLTPILQAICTDFSSPSLRHPQSEEKANLKPAQPHPRLCTESRDSYFLVSRQSCLADRTHCCPLQRLVALGPIQQAPGSNFCSFLFRLLDEPSGRRAEGLTLLSRPPGFDGPGSRCSITLSYCLLTL